MEFITCNDSNNNIEFIIDLIKGMQEDYHNSYWVISDLDLIPNSIIYVKVSTFYFCPKLITLVHNLV